MAFLVLVKVTTIGRTNESYHSDDRLPFSGRLYLCQWAWFCSPAWEFRWFL